MDAGNFRLVTDAHQFADENLKRAACKYPLLFSNIHLTNLYRR